MKQNEQTSHLTNKISRDAREEKEKNARIV